MLRKGLNIINTEFIYLETFYMLEVVQYLISGAQSGGCRGGTRLKQLFIGSKIFSASRQFLGCATEVYVSVYHFIPTWMKESE